MSDEVWQSEGLVDAYLADVRAVVPMAREQIGVMLAVLSTSERPLRRVLDLGCGDGILAAAVLERHPQARAVLADFSEPMLKAAREKTAPLGDRVRCLRVDYGEPQWVDVVARHAPFDAVVSGYSIHHQPDTRKKGVYAEVHGLLAPGAWFVNVEHVAPASAVTGRLFAEQFVEGIYRQRRRTGEPLSREEVRRRFVDRADKEANVLAPVETQCAWLREIGYRDVDCYFRLYECAVFGGRR
jgi:SAM-dependent methyltransferase